MFSENRHLTYELPPYHRSGVCRSNVPQPEEKKEGEEKENGEEEERDCGSSYKLEIFSMQKESVLNIASVPFGHIHGLDLD